MSSAFVPDFAVPSAVVLLSFWIVCMLTSRMSQSNGDNAFRRSVSLAEIPDVAFIYSTVLRIMLSETTQPLLMSSKKHAKAEWNNSIGGATLDLGAFTL